MLIGHIDTVDIARGWLTDPFTPTEDAEEEGKIHGLGAMDMKGGLAGILQTFRIFMQNTKTSSQVLSSLALWQTRKGCPRVLISWLEEGIGADYAIMAECRYDNVAIGFRGRYSFEVTVRGEAAHASKYPESWRKCTDHRRQACGSNRSSADTDSTPNLKHGTSCVRYIEGGNKGTLVVPDSCYIFVDRYVVPGETEETCIQQMQEAADKLGLGEKGGYPAETKKISLHAVFRTGTGRLSGCNVKREIPGSNRRRTENRV